MQSLFEKYRPREWDHVIGQSKAVGRVKMLEARGQLSGRAYWISGKSGTGKTTIAQIIAAKLSDEWHTVEIDAGQLTLKMIAETINPTSARCFKPSNLGLCVHNRSVADKKWEVS